MTNNSLRSILFEKHTIPELFKMIPRRALENIATVLLGILCIFLPFGNLASLAKSDTVAYVLDLRMVNLEIGYLSLLFGIFFLIWNHYQSSEKQSLRELLSGRGLPLFLLAMLLWSCLSCLFSTNPDVSLLGDYYRHDGLLAYFSYAGIFLLAMQLRDPKRIRLLQNIFIATAVLMAVIGIIDNPKIDIVLLSEPNRSVFYNQNHYGYFLALALPLAAGLMITAQKRWQLLVHSGELALLAYALIMCKTLGALLAVSIALLMLTILTYFVCRPALLRSVFSLFLCAAVMLFASNGYWDLNQDFSRLASDTGTAVDSLNDNQTETDSTAVNNIGSGRGELWVNAWHFVLERPLLGYGPDNLREVYAQAGCSNDRPHCEPLQFAASLGLPAMIFYLCGLGSLLLLFFKKFKLLGMPELYVYCAVGSYLISSLVGNTMFYTTPFFFLWLGCCFAQIDSLSAAPAPTATGDSPSASQAPDSADASPTL